MALIVRPVTRSARTHPFAKKCLRTCKKGAMNQWDAQAATCTLYSLAVDNDIRRTTIEPVLAGFGKTWSQKDRACRLRYDAAQKESWRHSQPPQNRVTAATGLSVGQPVHV
jgi:hypothetical protein